MAEWFGDFRSGAHVPDVRRVVLMRSRQDLLSVGAKSSGGNRRRRAKDMRGQRLFSAQAPNPGLVRRTNCHYSLTIGAEMRNHHGRTVPERLRYRLPGLDVPHAGDMITRRGQKPLAMQAEFD